MEELFREEDGADTHARNTHATYSYEMPTTNTVINLRLAGEHHSLWAHCLWNASVAMSKYLETHPHMVQGRRVAELGCGAGLPAIVSHHLGASFVMLTEYPDGSLLDIVRWNVDNNRLAADANRESIDSCGLRWGDHEATESLLKGGLHGVTEYDVVLMSDLVFNHSQHVAMLHTCSRLLAGRTPEKPCAPMVLVAFTHHRPEKAHLDLRFLEIASRGNLHEDTCPRSRRRKAQGGPLDGSTRDDCTVSSIPKPCCCTENVDDRMLFEPFDVRYVRTDTLTPMFPDDPGDPTVRSQVHFYILTPKHNK